MAFFLVLLLFLLGPPLALVVWLAGRGWWAFPILLAFAATAYFLIGTTGSSDTPYDTLLVLDFASIMAAGAVVRVVLLWCLPSRSAASGRPGNGTARSENWRRFLLLAIAAPLLLMAYQYWFGWPINPLLIKFKALQIADGAPLCLEVVGPSDENTYLAVTQWDELNRLPLFYSGGAGFDPGVAGNFYAILIIQQGSETEFYNWSYRRENFTRLTDPYWTAAIRRDPLCTPSLQYFDQLS